MMTITQTFAVVSLLILVLGLVAEYFKGKVITAPMVAVTFGYIVGYFLPNTIDIKLAGLQIIFQLTLIFVLFADSCQIKLSTLWHKQAVPLRMLLYGIPLSVFFGMIAGKIILPGFGFWEAALLAAILSCTDATLARSVVDTPYIPKKEQQILSLESNFNDGLVLPIILFLAVCDSIWSGVEYTGYWITFIIMQFGGGIVVGCLIGYIGSFMMRICITHINARITYNQLSGLATALLAFACAEFVHGNGYIAVVVASLVIANFSDHIPREIITFTEVHSELFSLTTFFIFGALVIGPILPQLTIYDVFFAFVMLFIVRMLAISISLYRSQENIKNTFLFGWFGPRGVASLLFVLLVIEKFPITHNVQIFNVVTLTVLLSIFIHGITSIPISKWYRSVS